MEKIVQIDIKHALSEVSEVALANIQKEVTAARKTLNNHTGEGNEFLGWVNLPDTYNPDELKRIIQAARKIRRQAKILVVIGIGGSYLGSKAAIELLTPYYEKKKKMEVVFAGNNMSSTYLQELVDYVKEKEFAVNVISKSGTTTEPAIAFRVFKKLLEEKYGLLEAKERIYVTTDKEKGVLLNLALEQGYETFVVPDDIGGRYSVLTPVGLLPIAAMNIDVKAILKGAKACKKESKKMSIYENDVHLYVAIRNLLYRNNLTVEMLVDYEPKLHYFAEWWKQLFGESEGKENKGLFVASAAFSTDLHSLGQYIQEGERDLFETVIKVKETKEDLLIESEAVDLDGLNYLTGKSMQFVNEKAFLGTLLAHVDGGVPNIVLEIDTINAETFGYMVYFFEKACAMSAYLLDVNPFDQPGVESYKKNMFALLGKKGFEALKETLEKKLK